MQFTDRQKEIVLVSINIIAKKGIQGLTIKNIAKKLEISEPAIYRHFDCKLDILSAILDYFGSNAERHLGNIEKQQVDVRRKLENMYLSHCKNFSEKPAMAIVVFSEEIFRQESRLSKRVYEIMQKHQFFIEGIIKQGQKEGSIAKNLEAKHLALIILGSLRLIVTQWRLSDFAFNLEEEGKKIWQSIAELIF